MIDHGEQLPTPPAIVLRAAGLSWADAFEQGLERLAADPANGMPDPRPLHDWIARELGADASAPRSVVVVDVDIRPQSALDIYAQAETTEPLRLAFVVERLQDAFGGGEQVAALSTRRCVVVVPSSVSLAEQVAKVAETLAELGRVSVIDLPGEVTQAQALVAELAA